MQWVQYDFQKPTIISSIGVYWLVDRGARFQLPKGFRVLCRKDDQWPPVSTAAPAPEADKLNVMQFEPIETQSVRLEATLKENSGAGVLEWWVR